MDLRLLQVHAHPDDEASKGAATNAKYSEQGVRTALVCCTGGEAGEILNPAMDRPEVLENIASVRMEELKASTEILGYDQVHLLGYHDSGMPDTETNERPDNFANAPLHEAVGKLVRIIREEKPHVVLGYAEDREFYPHPDHIRVHEITTAAFDASAAADQYPDAGEPWQPLKLYYAGWSPRRLRVLNQAYKDKGLESPFEKWFERGFPPQWEESFTTYVNVNGFLEKRTRALLAHRTQVDPEGFWFRLPDEVVAEVFPYEEFILAKSLVETAIPEDDLFAGIRPPSHG